MFIRDGGVIRGPFSLLRLQEMKSTGRLLPETAVSLDRLAWQPAGSFDFLYPELVQRTDPPKILGNPSPRPSAPNMAQPLPAKRQTDAAPRQSQKAFLWRFASFSLVAIIALIFTVWFTCFHVHLAGAKDAYSYARKSVVQVYVSGYEKETKKPIGWTGTAFCVSSNGLFVTNQHVVPGVNPNVEVDFGSLCVIFEGRIYPAVLVRCSRRADLALIEVKSLRLSPLPINDSVLPTGAAVYAAGFPYSRSEKSEKSPDLTISGGVVNNGDRRGRDGEDSIEHDAKINHGNSGGPLLDENGCVVGVNTWILNGENNGYLSIRAKAIYDEFPDFFGK